MTSILCASAMELRFSFKQWGTWGKDNKKRSKKANGRLFRGKSLGRNADDFRYLHRVIESAFSMVKRQYDWENGAKIGPHSKIKLEIIKEYIHEYVRVRCSLPQQERFRLSFVDGFCGAGTYECGTLGSPLVVLQTLKSVSAEVNLRRKNRRV